MRKYELLRYEDTILRVLEVEQDRVLVIDCIKQTMPVWVDSAQIDYYSECSKGILQEVTGIELVEQKLLDAEQKRIMHQRYTMIAPVPWSLSRPCSLPEGHWGCSITDWSTISISGISAVCCTDTSM